MGPLLFALFACSGSSNEGAAPSAIEPAPAAEAPAARAAEERRVAVDTAVGAAWGAVFWREERAWRQGGGEALIGPGGVGVATAGAEQGACGVALSGAPQRAVLALPAGVAPTALPEAPATRADLVERAAWRLDEALPPRDRFSPATSSTDPALQRGVRVGSVVKTRRANAPPLLFAAGSRECAAALVVLDQEAKEVLAWDRLEQVCDPLTLLPTADYDGDGQRELVAYTAGRVLLYRLAEGSGAPRLTRIGDWRCD